MQLLDFQTSARPDGLAPIGTTQVGFVELSQLPRFASTMESAEPLNVSLHYGRDEEGLYIQSSLKTQCKLMCQYCLSPFTFSLQSSTRFRPVLTLEATREVSVDCEPVLYENGIINIINMIEDDALLAIPNYPKCYACMDDNKADTFPSQFAILANSLAPEND